MQDIDATLLNGGTANERVTNDIKNILRAEGYPASSITVTITHAIGANVGQTFDLGAPGNAYGIMKIEVSVPYSKVSMFPFSISEGTALKASMVASRGRSTLTN